jgi:GTP-binding protein Era
LAPDGDNRVSDDTLPADDDAAADPGGPPAAVSTRCGFVALIGAPNAGKSTLINKLVGTKVSIVTHKVQTTRALVRGIALEGNAQIVFVDTPGIFRPRRRLDRAMVTTAWGGAKDADVVAVLIDARKGIDDEAAALFDVLAEVKLPKLLVLNKIDLVRRDSLLALAAEANARIPFERTFMVSALTGDGLKDFLGYLAGAVPVGPWLYPEDQVSDIPLRQLAAEVTREKLMMRLHDELPYEAHVETEQWKELRGGSVRIEQTIYVERDSQKKIVIGQGGETIKAISSAARQEITAIVERPVHLFLFVKVRGAWADDPERYREMGLDFHD